MYVGTLTYTKTKYCPQCDTEWEYQFEGDHCDKCEALNGYTDSVGKEFVETDEESFYIGFIWKCLSKEERIELVKSYMESKAVRERAEFQKKFYKANYNKLPPSDLCSIGDIERHRKEYCTDSEETENYVKFYHNI